MAISSDDALYRFEQKCRAMWEEARYRGDVRLADEIYRHFEQRKYEMSNGLNDAYLGAMQGLGNAGLLQNVFGQQAMNQLAVSNNTSTIQNVANQQTQAPPQTDFTPEHGVLYLHSKELPADWCGAKITEYRRDIGVVGSRWVITFASKWDKALAIRVYLDAEELNGKEVNAMAQTYMEALNQRRAG